MDTIISHKRYEHIIGNIVFYTLLVILMTILENVTLAVHDCPAVALATASLEGKPNVVAI
jgi:hypothetical protein